MPWWHGRRAAASNRRAAVEHPVCVKLAAAAGAAVHVQVVLGALAVSLLAVVCAQLFDGFRDVRLLVVP